MRPDATTTAVRPAPPGAPYGRGIPINDYDPDDLGEHAYRAIARVLDENRAARARRKAGDDQ